MSHHKSEEACVCSDTQASYDPVNNIDQIEAEMKTLKSGHWRLSEDNRKIISTFTCRNFSSAMSFLNAAAEIAERTEFKHHPDLHLTNYRDVEVVLYTHAVGGLTRHDFRLARALDEFPTDYSPKWLKEQINFER